ncbi:TIGR01458 family HAD-type hydrolase [Gilvimarinus sp. DA14]|uniref:TIGR01458 family HAD-type hydrolase n=1 Tax=Gilvimarinus sp. DA14 TaxID=2956798 RepID=UPI0020B7379D|nr:TIGR01458 family HAD-type hydrolase [Gilvimarinus sp. DA14]UTF60078.1 TIGR01458 family HAD-type hydrolase [Gilvimarinus sp. DA14]
MAIRAVFFDLSGVLYDGDSLIEGALEAVALARRRELALRFVTNTATKSRQQIVKKLQGLGIDLKPDELFTAPDAALAYIREHKLHPFTLVHQAIAPMFADHDGEPDSVVLGDAREQLTYASLNRAFGLLMQGKPLIGIGDNRYFSDGEHLLLDAGPFIHALSYAASVKPIIMGKPSADFFAQVVASVNVPATECLMLGDDVYGDIEGALNAGLQAALVQTGKYQAGDETKLPQPVNTLASVAALASVL